jgi:hypothetical protein
MPEELGLSLLDTPTSRGRKGTAPSAQPKAVGLDESRTKVVSKQVIPELGAQKSARENERRLAIAYRPRSNH